MIQFVRCLLTVSLTAQHFNAITHHYEYIAIALKTEVASAVNIDHHSQQRLASRSCVYKGSCPSET